MSINVLCVVGGISRNSLNRKLFHILQQYAPADFVLRDFDISSLPFFSQDLENDPPDVVVEWKDEIRLADAVLFITPEYNRSLPGVLKNAIDWGSRPYGQNLWDRKPAGVLGASISNIGTFGAQHHLRQVLAYLNLHVMGQPEFYFNASRALDEKGEVSDEKTIGFIQNYWSSFNEHVELFIDGGAARVPSQGLEDSPHAH